VIQEFLLPINKQDASGRRIRWSLLSGLALRNLQKKLEIWYSFQRKVVSEVQNVIRWNRLHSIKGCLS